MPAPPATGVSRCAARSRRRHRRAGPRGARVEVNLVAINDFHGRIELPTPPQVRPPRSRPSSADDDALRANTLLVGAGDLIGASEFASAIANDQPTIDVMNTLGLDVSAVGNHEFDKGWADLRDRVIGPGRDARRREVGLPRVQRRTSQAATCAARLLDVHLDSGTPADTRTMSTSASSARHRRDPDAWSARPAWPTLEFTEEVAATASTPTSLKDGNAANGEADVIVATFHAGAAVGTGSTFEARGRQGRRVRTAWRRHDRQRRRHLQRPHAPDLRLQAPKPGGGTRPASRPVSTPTNVGQIKMTVDADSGRWAPTSPASR